MPMNSENSQTSVDVCPLGFVAVLSPNADSAAEDMLRRILPDLVDGPYQQRSLPGMAMAARDDNLSISLTSDGQRDVVLLGHLVSECVGPEHAVSWAVSAIIEGRYQQLSKCQGVFVLLVLDWTTRTIAVAGDLLGTKPLYVAVREGVTILSDRAEAAVRLGGAEVDPLGLAGWYHFCAPLVNRTLFDSVERLPPATVVHFDGRTKREERFWVPPIAEEPISPEDLMDGFCEEFSQSLSRLLAPYDSATSLLSGGFDSRLALLTALAENRWKLNAITTPYSDAEKQVVRQLASLTGIDCEEVHIKHDFWDEFDQMWFVHPDGFPTIKTMSYLCIARSGSAGPFIDGSISAVAIRCHSGNPKDGPPANEAAARAFVWKVHAHELPYMYFRPEAAHHLEHLGRQAADEQSDAIGWNSKFCLLWDMYGDERRLTSLNFLQFAHRACSVQPFYDRSLIERHLRHPQAMSSQEFYRALLKRRFPGPGALPHADETSKGPNTGYLFSRTLWREIPAVAAFVHRHRDSLNSRWILPRLGSYALGWRRHMYVVLALTRLLRLEQELSRYGLDLDFGSIFARGQA